VRRLGMLRTAARQALSSARNPVRFPPARSRRLGAVRHQCGTQAARGSPRVQRSAGRRGTQPKASPSRAGGAEPTRAAAVYSVKPVLLVHRQVDRAADDDGHGRAVQVPPPTHHPPRRLPRHPARPPTGRNRPGRPTGIGTPWPSSTTGTTRSGALTDFQPHRPPPQPSSKSSVHHPPPSDLARYRQLARLQATLDLGASL
jgi:hypothetical protein